LYGRLLRVLYNIQLINNETKFVPVATSLGKDLVSQYLFFRYEEENKKYYIYGMEKI